MSRAWGKNLSPQRNHVFLVMVSSVAKLGKQSLSPGGNNVSFYVSIAAKFLQMAFLRRLEKHLLPQQFAHLSFNSLTALLDLQTYQFNS